MSSGYPRNYFPTTSTYAATIHERHTRADRWTDDIIIVTPRYSVLYSIAQ